MPNPWQDPEYAGRFRGGPIPNNPLRPEQVDVLLRLAAVQAPRRLLDVGCGPGLFASRLREAFPDAELTCCDMSEAMADAARERLGDRATVLCVPMEADWRGLLDGPFDVVFAVQSVHHLDAASKRRAWSKFFSLLRPGGLYLQSDPTEPATILLDHYKALWNRARQNAGFDTLPDDYDRAAFDEQMRRQGDLLEPLEQQLEGLRAVGFSPVDCFWRHGTRAIFGGLRPA